MKQLFIFVAVIAFGLGVYYYFHSKQETLKFDLTPPLTVRCENDLKTRQFANSDERDQYYIDCLAGKIY